MGKIIKLFWQRHWELLSQNKADITKVCLSMLDQDNCYCNNAIIKTLIKKGGLQNERSF